MKQASALTRPPAERNVLVVGRTALSALGRAREILILRRHVRAVWAAVEVRAVVPELVEAGAAGSVESVFGVAATDLPGAGDGRETRLARVVEAERLLGGLHGDVMQECEGLQSHEVAGQLPKIRVERRF